MSTVEKSANRPLALATVVILVLATGIGIYWYQFILTKPNECVGVDPTEKTFELTAKQWAFVPRALVVCDGDTIVLKIYATLDEDPDFDRHGFIVQSSDGATVSGTVSVLLKDEVTEIQFIAEKSGEQKWAAATDVENLRFFCTIFCGEGHSAMSGQITVG